MPMASASDKLDTFLNTSNITFPSLHPSDEEKWMDFIIAAYQESVEFTEADLEAHFAKVRHNDDEWTERRLEEYRFGRGLLSRLG